MKICSVCKKEKSIDCFYNYAASKDGKSYRCKECDNTARKKWQKNNPDKAKASQRRRNLQFKYGIDEKAYEKILMDQNYKCAICRTDNPKTPGGFCVDHCHITGEVRGLLCSLCNRGLGFLGDDIESLEKALEYLKVNKNVF